MIKKGTTVVAVCVKITYDDMDGGPVNVHLSTDTHEKVITSVDHEDGRDLIHHVDVSDAIKMNPRLTRERYYHLIRDIDKNCGAIYLTSPKNFKSIYFDKNSLRDSTKYEETAYFWVMCVFPEKK